MPHHLLFTGLYELPQFKNNRAVNLLAGGWQLSINANLQSGALRRECLCRCQRRLFRRLNCSAPGAAIGGLLLPATAQCPVKLNQRQQFVPSGLGYSQFGVEQVAVSIQGVEKSIYSATVPHIG